MSASIKCFAKIDDAEPSQVYNADHYQAISEPPSPSQNATVATFHRVVLNPNDADPKKQLQLHVRSGERNSTDPLRFERIEMYEEREGEPVLTWYGDVNGGTVARNDALVLKSEEEEKSDEVSFEELLASGAHDEALKTAIDGMDYKTLENELKGLNLPVPQKKQERRDALFAAVARKEKV